jgi:hypothetical protein
MLKQLQKGIYQKEVSECLQCDKIRVDLQAKLSKVSPVFPKLSFLFSENSIVQYSESITSHRLPSVNQAKKSLWIEFKKEIEFLHQEGYIHGDILLKNIVYDSERLRLVDHEIRLKEGNRLRFTYPWVALSDLQRGEITIETDQICLKATELRLLDNTKYLVFRRECMEQLRGFKFVRDYRINH